MHDLQENVRWVQSKFKNATYIMGGDMNLTCIDWVTEKVGKNPLYSTVYISDCEKFVELMNDIGLTQHITKVTRPKSGKTLDLILSNIPYSLTSTESMPGMSDHNYVYSMFNLSPVRTKRTPRKITCYDKANWEEIRKLFDEFREEYFQRGPDSFDIQENALFVEEFFKKVCSEFIPTKIYKSKHSYPWITKEVKRAQKNAIEPIG